MILNTIPKERGNSDTEDTMILYRDPGVSRVLLGVTNVG